MRRILFLLVLCLSFLFLLPQKTFAIVNPLAVPNNKFGIHILFDSELQQASQLVNSGGGQWGYVTIPIQAGDRDLVKWQSFMDSCKKLHLIPIIRLATQGDYFNTQVWSKPTYADILDFANFLNSLNWPVANRYVIIFNEVNRGDEWGGAASPAEYAQLLSYASTVFKSRSVNFFIISAGLDNAAPSQGTTYMNDLDFMRQMNQAVPGIFNQVDGLASHSYGNPGFAQPPNSTNPVGTGTFLFEEQLAKSMSNKDFPIFITETGWSSDAVSEQTIAQYYLQALQSVWTDSHIVAITPFLLNAQDGPFSQFSFMDAGGQLSKVYKLIHDLPKISGKPAMPPRVLAAETKRDTTIPVVNFSSQKPPEKRYHMSIVLENVLDWMIGI
jgi:hypothetical protein